MSQFRRSLWISNGEVINKFYLYRNYSTFKESLKDVANKEPTFLGRNYLSRKIYC